MNPEPVQESKRGGLLGWMDQRYGVRGLFEFLSHKTVPVGPHSMIWYYLGGTTLFFFIVQILSGLLLLLYYQPGEDTSYETIRFITTKVPFGWLMRSVHCWSAHLMIISLIVHMFSTMMLKAYRPPRELTWVSGFVLFALALAFGFSGYLLPWNELAFFATVVGTESVKATPVLGHWLLEIMRGGTDVTIHTLYRFFALHVVALPMIVFAFIGLHLVVIQRQGMATPMRKAKRLGAMPFFPNFLLRDLILWLLCLVGLLSLAVFWPYGSGIPGLEWELGQKANPLMPAYPGIKPEWYFLWIYQLLKEFPPHFFGLEGPQAAILLVGFLLIIWALVPWLDRKARHDERSPAFSDLGISAIVFIAYLTLKAWDIGGGGHGSVLPDPGAVARVCAYWMLGLAGIIFGLRFFLYGHRWYWLSGAAMLQVVLHGVVGLSYINAGFISLGLLAAGVALSIMRGGSAARGSEVRP